MPPLSLDCLTLTDTSPEEAIRAAAASGFGRVSLWFAPVAAFPRQVVHGGNAANCALALADGGVRVHLIEAFDLVSPAEVRAYRPAFDLGARLGARAVLFYHGRNPNGAEVADALGLAAELAADAGLASLLEPVAVGRTRTLAAGLHLIRRSGADVRLLCDTLHLMRSGDGVEAVRALGADAIGYVQWSDGPLAIDQSRLVDEAMGDRAFPGEGQFPLDELARLLPHSVPWAVEAPGLRRASAGMSAAMQAQAAMTAMCGLLGRMQDGGAGDV